MTTSALAIGVMQEPVGGQVVGCDIHYHQSLRSTMDEARRLADEGARDGTVVIAEEQTEGRGRFDRSWVSPVGQDLLFSVILRPTAKQLPQINMAAALSVCDTVQEMVALDAAIKWPNDVRIGGRKVSGILVESVVEKGEITSAVVGVGVNINSDQATNPELAGFATSLQSEAVHDFDRTEVMISLLTNLDRYYTLIRAGGSVTHAWADRLDTLGQEVQVQWKDSVYEGVATGVDKAGNLILHQPDGSDLVVVAGEVTLRVS